MNATQVSLVIPVRDEQESIKALIDSIGRQTLPPDEVVLVDGGSTDGTIAIVERLAAIDDRIRLIKTDGATPGRGRNIGIAASTNDWIALTDAGIRLEPDWLEVLVGSRDSATTDIVYGNYAPIADSLFEKCAAIAYAPAQRPGVIRGKSIASYLLKKEVWERSGGFPDMRAAEDLMFMEAAEAAGYKATYAPGALVHWYLRPDLASTFRKFALYSKHNVWAGRQWDWHYGILRQYALFVTFLLLMIIHSPWWLFAIPLWLTARAAKRILAHRFEYGIRTLFNPLIVLGVMLLTVTIDMATFVGWGRAKMKRGMIE